MKGFTLIDLMIVLAIGITIVCVIAATIVVGSDTKWSSFLAGYGTECVGGYLHSVSTRDGPRQIMDEYGHGIRCNQ